METSLSVQYAIPSGLSKAYWLHLEEKKRMPETVTPEEAAIVLDAIYDRDPCAGKGNDGEEDPSDPTRVIYEQPERTEAEVKALLITAFSKIGYDPCKLIPGTFDYETDIFVYRSHINEDYELILTNAQNAGKKIKNQWIDTIVKVDGNSVTLDFHIRDSIVAGAAIASIDGSTVYFTTEVYGYIRFQFWTTYEVITIRVPGKNGEPQSCKCLAFYHDMVSELLINPPDEDEEALNLMGCTGVGDGDDEDDPPDDPPESEDCYIRVIHSNLCRCSKNVEASFSYTKKVSCDTPGSFATEQGAYQFYKDAIEYIDHVKCPAEEGVWDGADPEYYLETCCVPVPYDMSLPICQSITWDRDGRYGLSKEEKENRTSHLHECDTTSFVPVPPKNNDCGTITYEWDVEAKNCCDSEFYTDLEYDEEDSVEILAPSSSGFIFWSGGDSSNPEAGIATITLHGSGFWLDSYHTEKSRVAVSGARVYTDENACGYCTIDIEDSCSSTSGGLKSTFGYWGNFTYFNASTYGKQYIEVDRSFSGYPTAYDGKYRIAQRFAYAHAANPTSSSSAPCCGSCSASVLCFHSPSYSCNVVGGANLWKGWYKHGVVEVILANSPHAQIADETACAYITQSDAITMRCLSTDPGDPCYPLCVCKTSAGWKFYFHQIQRQEWLC